MPESPTAPPAAAPEQVVCRDCGSQDGHDENCSELSGRFGPDESEAKEAAKQWHDTINIKPHEWSDDVKYISEIEVGRRLASLRAEVATMTAFAKTQQQLAADLENTLVKENMMLIEARAEVARLEKELREARSEMSTCDDIKLNQPLANCIADLQRERERLEKERDGLRLALEELPAQYVKGVTCAMTVREVYDWLKEAAEARIRELEGGK